MVKNYLLIVLRFMSKQRGFSVINIAGLTIGIACSLLILLYIQDELQYDRIHPDGSHIFRVGFEGKVQGKKIHSAKTGFLLAPALREALPEVESSVRVVSWATFPARYENKAFTEKYLLLADKNFFRFFAFNLISGHPDSVLTGKRKVVISESAARRYFDYQGPGDTSPIGKTLVLAQGYTVRISGIAEDAPLNTHFHYTLILSLDSWDDAAQDLVANQALTYLKLKPSASRKQVEAKLNDLIKARSDSARTQQAETGNGFRHFLQPLHDIHLRSHLSDEIEPNGNIDYIYLFSAIAVFITLLACINFMNLTTAQSASRAKEVAVRKSAGAQNNGLVFQFLVESYFYVIVAVMLALGVLLVALAPFNYFTGKALTFFTLFHWQFAFGLTIFAVLTGLVAGSYPAFYLTRYNPVEVLKGNLRAKLRSYGIRNVLVIFQFFISSCLIIATMVVYHQLEFVQRANLGFNKENIINLLHTRNLGGYGKSFKEELLKHPEIVAASYCNRLPPNVEWQSAFRHEGEEKDFLLAVYEMDYDHLKTMGYTLADGRFFSRETKTDSLKLLLNEKAAAQLKLENFAGKTLFSGYDQPGGRMREVIGIVRDFNFQSLKDPIQPMAIILGREPNWEMAIRVKAESLEPSIALIRGLWQKYAPEAPFEYTLVDRNFEGKLQTEKRIGLLFMVFTVLAIFIACLGLFGLATFTADQQRKAIGIRKVLGASVANIIRMLNRDFLKLVVIANLLAWPFTWWIMDRWLKQFAYHSPMPWWVFLLAGFITLFIAFFSVSFQALKAASGNPVNSLRNE